MTPTSIAIRLKPIMKRKIRTPELNVYAERLNLKRSNGKQGGNVCYVKAKELIDKFNDHVNPYCGSGMLSNTFDDDAIKYQSKHCVLICVEEILCEVSENNVKIGRNHLNNKDFWTEVIKEIEKL